MNTRERLLKAGEKEISKTGTAAVSLREIARDLGLSNMAAYRHFKSKDEFLSVLSGRVFSKFTENLSSAAASQSSQEDDALHQIGKAYFEFSKKKSKLFKLMFASELEPDEDSDSHDQGSVDRSAAYMVIRKAVEQRLSSANLSEEEFADEVDMYSFFCWCLIHGFCFIENDWFKNDSKNSHSRLEVLLDLAMKTLKHQSNG